MERFETVDAWTAYEHMVDLMGADQLVEELSRTLGTQELGEDLEYIARMEFGGGTEEYDRWEEMGWEDDDVYVEMLEMFGAENLLHSIAKALGNEMLEDNLAYIARMYGYEETDLGGEEQEAEFDEDESAELTDEEITNSLIINEDKSFRDSESAMEYLFGQEE